MAKSRAQRKAEQQKKRQQQLEDRARKAQTKAQHDTQVPESGDVAEVEAALEAGAASADRIPGEPATEAVDRPPPAAAAAETAAPAASAPTTEPASAPDEVGEQRLSRRDQRRADKEQARKARESAERRAPKEVKVERERNAVMAFFASVIAELRKVQWPDRDTLVQASAVTLLFVAVAATYLGVLDAIFAWLVDRLIA